MENTSESHPRNMGFEIERPQSTLGYKRLFGLFVGVERFDDTSVHFLTGSKEDATYLAQVFMESTHLQQLSEKPSLKILTECEATRENILENVMEMITQAATDDLILFYLSTHGLIQYNDYYFFPWDYKKKNTLGTGISATILINAFHEASASGVKVLLILDTCHSGAIGFDLSKYEGEFACLLSSSSLELSYETIKKERSIFTYHLTEALQGAREEGITLIDLYNKTYKAVQKETRKKQNPLLIGTMKNDTRII